MKPRLLCIKDWERLARQAEFEPGKMAALSLISVRQLERFFADHFHQTPREWAKALQCRLARSLIATGYSTKAAAAELKFADESHFCHEFKRVYGVCPQTFAPAWGRHSEMPLSDNNVAFRQSFAIAGAVQDAAQSPRAL